MRSGRIARRIALWYVALIVVVTATLGLYLTVSLRASLVAADIAGVEAAVRDALLAVVAWVVVATLLAALMAAAIARRILRPVKRLTEAALAIARGELVRTVRSEPGGTDGEIGELANAFDEMAERLRAVIDSLSTDRGRLSAVLAAMADGLVLVDGDQRVILANLAATQLLGLPERTFDASGPGGTSAERLIELVPDHELYELVRQTATARLPRRELVRLGPADRHLRITATPMPPGEAAVLLLVQDVTEVRRAETIRRDFAANVSHELKTPIASLKALVETLEDGALDDPPAAREFLHRMHVEVDDLAQLVGELVELSRIESGRARMTFEQRDPADLVASATDRLRPQAVRAGVELIVAPGPNLPSVRADATRIEGAVINLVHNAIKFTPPGGRIEVRAESAALDGEPLVRVSVVDNGAGIPADDLPRLFERFYKTDKSRASSGTGLGLAIVKHVVQAHGGQVGVESTFGQGSTFWFTLPAVREAGTL